MQINPRVHAYNRGSAFAVRATLQKLHTCYRLSRCRRHDVTVYLLDYTSRSAECEAKTYRKIRRRLTRQIHTGLLKHPCYSTNLKIVPASGRIDSPGRVKPARFFLHPQRRERRLSIGFPMILGIRCIAWLGDSSDACFADFLHMAVVCSAASAEHV